MRCYIVTSTKSVPLRSLRSPTLHFYTNMHRVVDFTHMSVKKK